MRRDASFLEAKRRARLHWTTHADRLAVMREHVNDLARMLSELESMKPQASLLQQKAIETARPHLEQIASDLNSAIRMLKEDRRNISRPEYLSTLHSVSVNADTLYKRVDAITDYKEAQKRLNTMMASASAR